jgi:hypothetical protein
MRDSEYFKDSDMCSDRLCGLEVRVLDYISRGHGSIPEGTTFSEK